MLCAWRCHLCEKRKKSFGTMRQRDYPLPPTRTFRAGKKHDLIPAISIGITDVSGK